MCKSMLKTHLKRLEKLEERFSANCIDDAALDRFNSWLKVNYTPHSLYWMDAVPKEHERALKHWLTLALEHAKDKSRELVRG